MVTTEVTDIQQVTTCSKGKAAEWDTQDNIRKQATEWIKKANERNMAEIQEQNAQPEEPVKSTEDDPTRATIRPSTTISSPVHRRAQNNIHRIKPGAGAGILL